MGETVSLMSLAEAVAAHEAIVLVTGTHDYLSCDAFARADKLGNINLWRIVRCGGKYGVGEAKAFRKDAIVEPMPYMVSRGAEGASCYRLISG